MFIHDIGIWLYDINHLFQLSTLTVAGSSVLANLTKAESRLGRFFRLVALESSTIKDTLAKLRGK